MNKKEIKAKFKLGDLIKYQRATRYADNGRDIIFGEDNIGLIVKLIDQPNKTPLQRRHNKVVVVYNAETNQHYGLKEAEYERATLISEAQTCV